MHALLFTFALALAVFPANASGDRFSYQIPAGFLLKTGAPFPSVELQGLDNRSHNTREFVGKPTVVSFFTSYCGPCIKEIPALNQFVEQYPDIRVVAISPDSASTLAALKEMTGSKWTVLANAQDALNSWGVVAFPSFALIDANGTLVSATYGNRLSSGDGYASPAGIHKWVRSVLPET